MTSVPQTSAETTSAKRVNYGIDAPGTALLFLLIGIAGISAGLILILIYRGGRVPGWYGAVVGPCLTIGVTLFLQSLVMVWGSKVGKLRLRDRVIGAMAWRGDEAVLDVGCGHALMLIAAAKRLRTGRAVGIDMWIRADQAGNSREATWSNVVLEKMTDRVELKDGDARKLPFPDGAFDVVLSSWALHNIHEREGRESAIREIIRVLKPGGRVAIVDIRRADEYARVFESGGMSNVQKSGPNFVFVIPTRTVTATKAE